MFYSVASPGWKPGQPLNPVGALLFRSRSEAESFAPDGSTVAVAVRFDERWRVVRPRGSAALSASGPWSAPAIGNALGGLTVFGPIPPGLVRPSNGDEALADWRPRVGNVPSGDHRVRPSNPANATPLTMALLA